MTATKKIAEAKAEFIWISHEDITGEFHGTEDDRPAGPVYGSPEYFQEVNEADYIEAVR